MRFTADQEKLRDLSSSDCRLAFQLLRRTGDDESFKVEMQTSRQAIAVAHMHLSQLGDQ